MKSKGLLFVSCLAAGALIASPALSRPAKKSAGHLSRGHAMAARTTQVMPTHRYNQATTSHVTGTRYYGGMRYSGTRAYAGRQYSGTRYYGGTRYAGTRYYGNTGYYGGTPYYYGSGYPYYGSSSVWPYVAASVAPYVASSFWGSGYYGYPNSYYGGYPYNSSYYGGYPYNYSYYSGYAYSGATVAAVQRRLGQLGYYHGSVDGVAGPQTRSAIASFESRNGLVVDGRISRPLLDRMGLA